MFAPGFQKSLRSDITRCAQPPNNGPNNGRTECCLGPPELGAEGKAPHIQEKTEKLPPLPDHIFVAHLRHDAQLRLSASLGKSRGQSPGSVLARQDNADGAFCLLPMLRSFAAASPAMSVPGQPLQKAQKTPSRIATTKRPQVALGC